VAIFLSCFIRDKARYWSIIAVFYLYSTGIWRRYGGSLRNIAIKFSTETLEWCGYKIQHRRTGILRQHSPRYAYASRGEKCPRGQLHHTESLTVVSGVRWTRASIRQFGHVVTWVSFSLSVYFPAGWLTVPSIHPIDNISAMVIAWRIREIIKTVPLYRVFKKSPPRKTLPTNFKISRRKT